MEAFKEHVFISYAHRDNQTPAGGKGWVTQFDEALRTYLGQRLGVDPLVWRDAGALQGNSALTPEILEGLASSAVLVSVLSPSYVNSQWCQRELNEFCKRADQHGGLLVANKSRVLKVIMIPPGSTDALPDALHDVLDYRFYRESEDGALSLAFDPSLDSENRTLFIQAVARVAADAARLIKDLESTATGSNQATTAAPSGANEKITASEDAVHIFLADCTPDRREDRERLASDLKLSGHIILPETTLPIEIESEYRQSSAKLLQKCQVSIHMIGNRYGVVPDGDSEKSIIELQNEVAASMSQGGALRRIIWLPNETQPQGDRQKDFIARLHSEATAQAGADLVSGNYEELTSTVHRLIKSLRSTDTPQAKDAQQTEKSIYLVCSEGDLKQTIPLRKWLKQAGIEVERPVFDGNAQTLRKANQELIRRCSGLLVYYGSCEDTWFRAIESDHRKIRTYRAGMAAIPRYTYIDAPDRAVKQDLLDMDDGGLVIDGRNGFKPGLLDPLLKDLQENGSSPS